jgi:hypothetical protein
VEDSRGRLSESAGKELLTAKIAKVSRRTQRKAVEKADEKAEVLEDLG